MVVACVRLNHINTDAYAQCFEAVFQQVSEDHPTFKVVTGIIADWSDQQVNGLAKTVGKSTADNILKGLSKHLIIFHKFKALFCRFILFDQLKELPNVSTQKTVLDKMLLLQLESIF